ncbi:PAS domain-containing protein [Azospirillum sp. TSO22-1]|uniref:PAS domain-containing sensor histidine kinase n=1 Tax=Azospirillum sp. TSO22-1 TaxID=716789 RepID=UPI000D64ACC8|nr:PAS domain-containing protein [Azospirillum sp. TSO22-1]
MQVKDTVPGAIDWRAIFMDSPTATCIVGVDERIVVANAAFAALIGRDAAEALAGLPFDQLTPLHGIEGAPAFGADRGTAFLVRSDGECRDVTFAARALPDGSRLVTLSDVTEDKCFVCKIFSSRDKFRTTVDDQTELVCRFQPDLTVTVVNRELAALCGTTPREFVAGTLRDHLPPATVAAAERFIAEAAPGSAPESSEEPWPNPDGTTRWITWRRLAVFDAGGRLTAIQTVGRDTTHRRLAEQERIRLAAMINRSPVVGVVWRTEGRLPVEFVTDNAGRRLRIAGARLAADSGGFLDVVHPDDRAALAGWVAACPEVGAPWQMPVRIVNDDGETRWVSASGWRSGPGRMEAVLLDITAQRAASMALRERERRFRAIFDHTFEFIGLLDTGGRMIEVNETALRFIGATEDQMRGKYFWDTPWWAHAPADQERLKAAVARAAAGAFLRFETTHTAPDGAVMHVDFSLRPIYDGDGAVIYLLPEGRDITHLKDTEAALLAAKREAEAANRSKTNFLAVMSHELRTPLNAILGYSEVMQTGLFGPVGSERYKGYVDAIHLSGRHLLGIIDDILEVSRIELGVLELSEEVLPVGELVSRAAQILTNRAAEAGVTLEFDVPCPLPWLRCDARRVIQMLVNLTFNSLKFTRRGGTVTIAAAGRPDGGVDLAVRDTGTGIAPEDLVKVWEPFGQAGTAHTRPAGGVGLGLSITKALIEAHGGTISLHSELYKGTAVTLSFPAARCEHQEEPQALPLPVA